MKFRTVLILVIIISLFPEATLLSFPLTFPLLLLLYILYPETSVLIFALSIGLILNAIRITSDEITPILIFLSYGAVELLRRFFEIKDYKNIIIYITVSSFIYSLIVNKSISIVPFVIIYGLVFVILSYTIRKKILW